MADETTQMPDLPPSLQNLPHGESRFLGITIRGWIALVVIFTVCVMSVCKIQVVEPLNNIAISTISFYLGSRMPMMNGSNGK